MASKGFKGEAQSAWRSCKKFRLVVGRKNCYPLLICSFRISQFLSPECHSHFQHNARNILKQDMLCLAEFIFSLLEWNVLFILDFNVQQSTLHTANQSCGQIVPFCFLHRRSNQIAWSTAIVFPPSWLPLMPCQPQSGSAFERIQQSRWILSGSLARSTMPSQRQCCCTFSKNLNSFASLVNIFQLCSCPLDSASTNSENDGNHAFGALAGRFRRNCTISVLRSSLARSSGVSPRLKANLSPKIRIEWGGLA